MNFIGSEGLPEAIVSNKPCPHVALKRQNVGDQHWYKCAACPQKFKETEWNGKVQVLTDGDTAQSLDVAEFHKFRTSTTDWENLRPDGTPYRDSRK